MNQDTIYLTIVVAAYCAPQIAYYIGNSPVLRKCISDKLFGGLENKLETHLKKGSEIIEP